MSGTTISHAIAPIPRYGLAGLLIMTGSEVGMLMRVEPFWTWHTPIAWTGYVLFADAFVWSRRRRSWIADAPAEFAFLIAMSVPLWLVFEGYNLLIRNWQYVNLPENRPLRWLGYAWSFGTIWPAIFVTGEVVAVLRDRSQPDGAPSAAATPADGRRGWDWLWMAVGLAFLIWPLAWPSPYLAAPVWLGFLLLVDPINARLGEASLFREWRQGSFDRVVNLSVAGVVCGLLWEFWNYWARAKWVYSVPILPDLKVFEMPVLGYLGFPAFALECFAMYVLTRRLVWRGPYRAISL
jgi:hypothetical protein